MSISAALCGAARIDGGPSINLGAAARLKEQRRREFELSRVTCPQCGGEAWAELAPVSIWRNGETRTVRVGTCSSGCQQMRIKNGVERAAGRYRFEIVIHSEVDKVNKGVEMSTEDLREDHRSVVRAAIDKYGRGGRTAAALSVGLASASGLCRWLKGGNSLSQEKVDGLLKWADSADTFNEAPLPVLEPEKKSRVELEIHVDTAQAEASLARVSRAFEKVDQEALLPISVRVSSPADLMLQAVAERGARAELERLGLDLPEGAKLTVSLEWCA